MTSVKMTYLAVGLGVLVCGGGLWYYVARTPQVDTKAFTDRQVQKWDRNPKTNAADFLKANGRFYGKPEATPGVIDRDFAAPLVKQLQDQAGVETVAVIRRDDPKQAIVFMVDLKKYEAKLDQIKSVFKQADETFPGIIMQQYGNDWMYFQFLSHDDATALNLGENWGDRAPGTL